MSCDDYDRNCPKTVHIASVDQKDACKERERRPEDIYDLPAEDEVGRKIPATGKRLTSKNAAVPVSNRLQGVAPDMAYG